MPHATPGRKTADRRILAAVVAAVGLIGCVSCSSQAPPAAERAVPAVGQTVVEASGSPLEAVLGIASDPEQRRRQIVGWQRAADEAVVACMAEQGFFYAVDPADALLRVGAGTGDGTRAWAEVNGFGITTSVLIAMELAAASDANAAASNLAYVASLTEEQSRAYDRALIGESPVGSVPVGSDPADASFVPAGCWGDAYRDMLVRFAYIDEFGDELGSLNSRLASDPRATRLDDEWSTCMEAAGYDHANRTELIESIYGRLVDLELVDAGGYVSFGSQPALDEVLVEERAAAVASFDCRGPLADELTRLRYDYEREFLDDNRFRIDNLVDDS